MKTCLSLLTLTFLLPSVRLSAGEDVATKHTLTLEGARKAGDAAAAYAQSNGAPGGAIAVVDDGGHLLYFLRLEGTFTASPNISIGKARTAALFRKPTRDFEETVNKGRFEIGRAHV